MTTIRRKLVLSGLVIMVQAMTGASTAGQLPPESALPGEPALLGKTALLGEPALLGEQGPRSHWPGESELTADLMGPTSARDEPESLPQRQESSDDATRRDDDQAALPSENALPQGQDDSGNRRLSLAGPDGIPWLQLNLPGHTGALQAVAFSPDGKRIFSAGDDKALLVWTADRSQPNQLNRWSYERAIRWQIQRGTRGRINALATTPEFVAFAGEGAMGGNGEILLVDPRSGQLTATLVDLDVGHRQVIVGLSASATADSNVLASQSMDGCLVHWKKNQAGLWRPTRLRAPDVEVEAGDQQLLQQLQQGRSFSQIAALAADRVVAGVFSERRLDRTIWRLQIYDAAQGTNQPLAIDEKTAPHWDYVTAMAVARGGQFMASADGGGHVYLWDLSGPRVEVRRLPPFSTPIISLSFDKAGRTLALGSASAADAAGPWVEVWEIPDNDAPRRLQRISSDEMVRSCSLSNDGKSICWTNGNHLGIGRVGGQVDRRALVPGARPPMKVAFSKQPTGYRLGIGKSPQADGQLSLEYAFDTSLLRLDQLNQTDHKQWQTGEDIARGWDIRQSTATGGETVNWLHEDAARRSRLPLPWYESVRTHCWIPDPREKNRSDIVAVGTSNGTIVMFALADEGVAPVIRRFRGHTASVTSLTVSADQKYLASSSIDGTVRLWPLTNLREDPPPVQRWGTEFVVQERVLIASSVRADGPLHFRGLRQGDRIEQISFIVGNQVREVTDPDEILRALEEMDWHTIVTFRYVRGRGDAKEFQLLPAWQQLVTLFVADNGQWAYWAPSGYYDASFEGHKLFGWQVNRGLELLPDFFLAAQFRKQLERPGAMSRLLEAGNLEDAFKIAQIEPPANSQNMLVNAYRLKPQVEILSPQADDVVEGRTTVIASVTVDASQQLVPPKAFANGVVAVQRRLLSQSVKEGLRESEYEWELSLPSDRRILVQVTAATEDEISASAQVLVDHNPPVRSEARLFLLSVGVDNYRDAQIPKLATAVRSTHQLLEVMQNHSSPIYRLDAASLLEERATKASWRLLTQDFATDLSRNVSPDDLLVIFLSGHGVRSSDDAGYQFITADARYADVLSGKYADCLSFADLSAFAQVPCRKLVILNTCHGGSIQPLMHREMKSIVRDLQDDLLLTLAASGGEQEAVEGRFSQRLMEALKGAADMNSNGIVTLGETVAYVQQNVAIDSAADPVRQFPTAGPQELLPYATVALSATDKWDRQSRQLGYQARGR